MHTPKPVYKTIAGIRFLEADFESIARAARSQNRSLTNYIRDAAIRDSKAVVTDDR